MSNTNLALLKAPSFFTKGGCAAVAALCALLAGLLPSARGQEVLHFNFERGGVFYEGGTMTVTIVPAVENGEVILTGEEPFALKFSDWSYRNMDKVPQLLMKSSYVSLSSRILQHDREEYKARSFLHMSFVGTGGGDMTITIKKLAFIGLPNSAEAVEIDLSPPYSKSFTITRQQQSQEDPPAGDENLHRPADDQLWEAEWKKGVHGIASYLERYGSSGNHAHDARERLRDAVNLGQFDARDAAEIFLEHFPGDPFAPVAEAARDKQDEQENKEPQVLPQKNLAEERCRQLMSEPGSPAKLASLENFIEENPRSECAQRAMRLVPTKSSFTGIDTSGTAVTYSVTLKFALNPVLADTAAGAGNVKLENGALQVVLPLGVNDTLEIWDAGKDSAVASLKIPFGNNLVAALVPPAEGMLLAVRLTNGTPPLRLLFYLGEKYGGSSDDIKATNTTLSFSMKDLRRILGGKGGTFSVRAVELESSGEFKAKERFTLEPARFPWEYAAGAGVLLLAAIAWSRLRKKARRRELEAKYKKIEEEKAAGAGAATRALPEAAAPDSGAATGTDGASTTETATAMLNIRSIKKASGHSEKSVLSREEFASRVGAGGFFKIDLTRLWSDTALTELHLSRKSIADLGRFLRSQNIHEIKEQEGTVPEIGGFLLGKCHRYGDGGRTPGDRGKLCQVAVEEFVPVSPKTHNVYQLEFSTASIAQELGEAQEKFPDLVLVAWFHTHPGHGLFLSSPDLQIHEGFFQESYQFAMETDSLTENLETGFFTRTLAGKTNNKADLKPEARWLAWTEIEKAAKGMRDEG